jgi:DNA-binding response OmpR family regulator
LTPAPVLLLTTRTLDLDIQEQLLRDGFLLMTHGSVPDDLEAAASGGHALILVEGGYFKDAVQGVAGLRAIAEIETTPVIVFGISQFDSHQADSTPGDLRSDELRMRMHAAVRRFDILASTSVAVFGDLELDMRRFRARRRNRSVPLTAVQMRLLKHFMDNPTTPFTRRELIEAVWDDNSIDDKAVTAAVLRLRRALTQGGLPDLIRTIPEVGYALEYEARD